MQIKKQLKTELKSQPETQKSDTVQTLTFRDKRYQAKTQVSNDSLNLEGIVMSLKSTNLLFNKRISLKQHKWFSSPCHRFALVPCGTGNFLHLYCTPACTWSPIGPDHSFLGLQHVLIWYSDQSDLFEAIDWHYCEEPTRLLLSVPAVSLWGSVCPE